MHNESRSFLNEFGLEENDFINRGLILFEEATELVITQVDKNGRIHELTPLAGKAWHNMKKSALLDGIDLFIVSAFRSIARQAEIVRNKSLAGQGFEEIFTVSAPPGFSEHHTGRAIDISSPGEAILEEAFEHSPAFSWLNKNAARFGFTMTYPQGNPYGFSYEPWHWCYQPD